MSEFRMPSLGADMEAATLIEWLVKPGDPVKRGDIIAVVETQKGTIEIEVFEDGVLEECVAGPGTELPVGAVMARISGTAVSPEPAAPAAVAPIPPPTPAAPSPPPAAPAPPPRATGLRATPAARRLARERGIDIAAIKGTGPSGAITHGDVAAHKPERPAGYDFAKMRQAIAAAMARSKREIPHYYLSNTIDIGSAQGWIAEQNAQRAPGERLLLGALFVKAVALAAREYREFNGFYLDGAHRPSAAVHAGVAISIRGGGLVAPAIHDAADLDMPSLMAKLRDLVARVRAGRFRSSEIADATITVSSLGERGVEALWGVIYPPQVALVGFGKTLMRPWASEGELSVRPTVCVTLAGDHRASDGHRGALFLDRIGLLLAKPEDLR